MAMLLLGIVIGVVWMSIAQTIAVQPQRQAQRASWHRGRFD